MRDRQPQPITDKTDLFSKLTGAIYDSLEALIRAAKAEPDQLATRQAQKAVDGKDRDHTKEWFIGDADTLEAATEAASIGDVQPGTEEDYRRGREAMRSAWHGITAKAAKVSGKRRKKANPYAGAINIKKHLQGHPKPRTRRTRRTVAPLIRIVFRVNGNGGLEAPQVARAAGLVAGAADAMNARGFAVRVDVVVFSFMPGTDGRIDRARADCRVINVHKEGHKYDWRRVMAAASPAVHRVWAREVRKDHHFDLHREKADAGWGSSGHMSEDHMDACGIVADVVVDIDSTGHDIAIVLDGLMGKIGGFD